MSQLVSKICGKCWRNSRVKIEILEQRVLKMSYFKLSKWCESVWQEMGGGVILRLYGFEIRAHIHSARYKRNYFELKSEDGFTTFHEEAVTI